MRGAQCGVRWFGLNVRPCVPSRWLMCIYIYIYTYINTYILSAHFSSLRCDICVCIQIIQPPSSDASTHAICQRAIAHNSEGRSLARVLASYSFDVHYDDDVDDYDDDTARVFREKYAYVMIHSLSHNHYHIQYVRIPNNYLKYDQTINIRRQRQRKPNHVGTTTPKTA